MRFFSMLSMAAAALMAVTSAETAPKCTSLVDKTSPFYSVLPLVMKNLTAADIKAMPIEKVLKPVDEELPWLTKCLGSANLMAVGAGVLANSEQMTCVKNITNRESALGFSDTYFTKVMCPFFKTTVLPCMDKLVIKVLNDLMKSTPCCDDMREKMNEGTGGDADKFIKNLVTNLADVICSTKTFYHAGAMQNETCGYSLMDTIGSGKVIVDISKMFQVPNKAACKAMEGETFETSSGDKYKFFESQTPGMGQIPLDVCFQPLNNLLTFVGDMPMWDSLKTGKLETRDMFKADKCMKGQDVLDWTASDGGFVHRMSSNVDEFVAVITANGTAPPANMSNITETIRVGIKSLEKGFGSLCFHIPNNVTDCSYNSTLAYAYSTQAPPTPKSKDGKGGEGDVKSAAASVRMPVLMTAVSFVLGAMYAQ